MNLPARFPLRLFHVLAIFVVLATLYLLANFYGTSVESYWLEQRAQDARRDIARLEKENQFLIARVARAKTDDYIETIARDRLNMIRSGDRPLIMLRVKKDPTPRLESLPRPMGDSLPKREAASLPMLTRFGHVNAWLSLFFGPTPGRR